MSVFNLQPEERVKVLQDRLAQLKAERDALDALTPKPKPPPAGMLGNAEAGFLDTAGTGLSGLGDLLGSTTLGDIGKSAKAKARELVPEEPEGILNTIAYYGAGMAPMALGAIGGGAAAGAAGLGELGAGLAGLAGASALNYPVQYGGNLEEQAQNNNGVVQDRGAAMLAAVPQTILDSILDVFAEFKILGLGGKALKAGDKLPNIFTKVGRDAITGALIETPTEIGQQVIQRMQAGESPTSPDAINQYLDIARTAGLMGGVFGGVGGGFEHFSNKKELAGLDKAKADKDAADKERDDYIAKVEQVLADMKIKNEAEKAAKIKEEGAKIVGNIGNGPLLLGYHPAPQTNTNEDNKLSPAEKVKASGKMAWEPHEWGDVGEEINKARTDMGLAPKTHFTTDDLMQLRTDQLQKVMPVIKGEVDLNAEANKTSKKPLYTPQQKKAAINYLNSNSGEFSLKKMAAAIGLTKNTPISVGDKVNLVWNGKKLDKLHTIAEMGTDKQGAPIVKLEGQNVSYPQSMVEKHESSQPVNTQAAKALLNDLVNDKVLEKSDKGKFNVVNYQKQIDELLQQEKENENTTLWQEKNGQVYKVKETTITSPKDPDVARVVHNVKPLYVADRGYGKDGKPQPFGLKFKSGELFTGEDSQEPMMFKTGTEAKQYLEDMKAKEEEANQKILEEMRKSGMTTFDEGKFNTLANNLTPVPIAHDGDTFVEDHEAEKKWAVTRTEFNKLGKGIREVPHAVYNTKEEAELAKAELDNGPKTAPFLFGNQDVIEPKFPLHVGAPNNDPIHQAALDAMKGKAEIPPATAAKLAEQSEKDKSAMKDADLLKKYGHLFQEADKFINELVKQFGLDKTKIKAELQDSLSNQPGSERLGLFSFRKNLIQISLASAIKRGENPAKIKRVIAGIFHHEAFHAFKANGLITDEEWSILTRDVKTRKMSWGGGKTYYQFVKEHPHYKAQMSPEQMLQSPYELQRAFKAIAARGEPVNAKTLGAEMYNLSEDLALDEAAAFYMGDWANGNLVTAKARTTFQKIMDIIMGLLGRLEKTPNYEGSEHIFKMMSTGQFGSRTPSVDLLLDFKWGNDFKGSDFRAAHDFGDHQLIVHEVIDKRVSDQNTLESYQIAGMKITGPFKYQSVVGEFVDKKNNKYAGGVKMNIFPARLFPGYEDTGGNVISVEAIAGPGSKLSSAFDRMTLTFKKLLQDKFWAVIYGGYRISGTHEGASIQDVKLPEDLRNIGDYLSWNYALVTKDNKIVPMKNKAAAGMKPEKFAEDTQEFIDQNSQFIKGRTSWDRRTQSNVPVKRLKAQDVANQMYEEIHRRDTEKALRREAINLGLNPNVATQEDIEAAKAKQNNVAVAATLNKIGVTQASADNLDSLHNSMMQSINNLASTVNSDQEQTFDFDEFMNFPDDVVSPDYYNKVEEAYSKGDPIPKPPEPSQLWKDQVEMTRAGNMNDPGDDAAHFSTSSQLLHDLVIEGFNPREAMNKIAIIRKTNMGRMASFDMNEVMSQSGVGEDERYSVDAPDIDMAYANADMDTLRMDSLDDFDAALGHRVRVGNTHNHQVSLDKEGAYVKLLESLQWLANKVTPNLVKKYFGFNKEDIDNWVQRMYMVFADKDLPIGKLVDTVRRAGGYVDASTDPMLQAELKGDEIVPHIEMVREKIILPIIEAMHKYGISLGELNDFLYLRHAKERNALVARRYAQKIRQAQNSGKTFEEIEDKYLSGSGYTDAEVDELMGKIRQEGKFNELKIVASLYDKLTAETTQIRIDSGLLPPMDILVDGENYPGFKYYCPLRGDESLVGEELSDETIARVAGKYLLHGLEDKHITGRHTKATNILQHTILQNYEAIIRSKRAEVGRALYNLVKNNQSATAGIVQILEDQRPMRKVLTSDGRIIEVVDHTWKQRPEYFVTKIDGKEVLFAFAEKTKGVLKPESAMLSRALRGFGRPSDVNNLVKALQGMNQFLTRAATAWNPEFTITNLIKDFGTAMFNVGQHDIPGIRKDMASNWKGAYNAIYRYDHKKFTNEDFLSRSPRTWTMDQMYHALRRYGGVTQYYGRIDLQSIDKLVKEDFNKLSGKETAGHFALDKFKKVVGVVEHWNTTIEHSIRLSTFKSLLERGVPIQRAAQTVKNLTVNFNKGGEQKVLVNALYLFYNASMQGTVTLFTAMARNPKLFKGAMYLTAMGFLMDQINRQISDEDKDGNKAYDQLKQYKKESALNIPIGGGQYFSIPLPWGLQFFYNNGRAMSDAASTGNISKNLTSMMSGLVSNFSPIGSAENFANFVTPTVLDPIVNVAMNRDWDNTPIQPVNFPVGAQKPNSQLYWNNTSSTMVDVAAALNKLTWGDEHFSGAVDVSPNMLEYGTNYMLGGAGMFVLRSGDFFTDVLPKIMSGDEWEWNQIPFFRRVFTGRSSATQQQKFHENVQNILNIDAAYNDALKSGDADQAKEYMSTYGKELSIAGTIKAMANQRTNLSKQITEINKNQNVPDAYKASLTRVLKQQENDLMTQVNGLYGKYVEGGR